MARRLLIALSALLCLGSALVGAGFSGTTWTDTSTYAASVSAANDWTPPTVSVTSPGSIVTGSVTISAQALDSRSSVASLVVQYAPAGSMMWQTLGGCTATGTTPMTVSCPWSTTGLTDGGYQLQAIATDTAGNTATSAAVATTVANNVRVVLTRLPSAVRGTVTVRGDLVNPVAPTTLKLEYRSGTNAWTQLNGSCTSSATPIQCAWDTSKVPDGTYDVRVVAGTGQTDTQTGIVVDNTAPTGSVTVPAGNLSGTVTLAATGGDSGAGVASVRIQYTTTAGTWVDCGTGATSPYSCSLDTTRLSDGPHDFRVVVTDAAGNTTTSATVTRTVVNSTPSVSITNPAANASLDGTVSVTGQFTSPNGVRGIVLEYQSAPSGAWQAICTPTGSPYSCSWNTTALANGSYNVRATLTPTYGNAVTSTVAVTVQHPFSNVSIASPTGGTVSGQVAISGPVSSSGTITKVVVTATPAGSTGGTPLTACTATSPTNGGSFSCSWATNPTGGSTIVYGSYVLTATMTDSNGTKTSNTVTVLVDNILASVVLGDLPANLKGTSQTLTATASSNAGVTGVRFEGTVNGTTTTLCTATLSSAGVWTCPWNISGVTYGDYSVQAVMTQGLGAPEVRSATKTTRVDNRTLAGSAITITNGPGGADKIINNGDKIAFTYSGLVDPAKFKAGLTNGGSLPIDVSMSRSGNDVLMTVSSANVGQLLVGASPPYISGSTVLTFTGSTMTASQTTLNGNPVTVITITLGTPSSEGEGSKAVSPTLVWTPPAVTDAFGVPCSTTPVNGVGSF